MAPYRGWGRTGRAAGGTIPPEERERLRQAARAVLPARAPSGPTPEDVALLRAAAAAGEPLRPGDLGQPPSPEDVAVLRAALGRLGDEGIPASWRERLLGRARRYAAGGVVPRSSGPGSGSRSRKAPGIRGTRTAAASSSSRGSSGGNRSSGSSRSSGTRTSNGTRRPTRASASRGRGARSSSSSSGKRR